MISDKLPAVAILSWCVCLLLLLARGDVAQIPARALIGTVSDTSDGRIAGATVSAEAVGLSLKRVAATNSSGEYRPGVDAREQDKGESRKYRILKARPRAPKDADLDKSVTLEGLLEKKDQNDWSTAKAAGIEGYVIQLEREEDGDYHMVLAANAGETDTTKWVIVEVTPAWARRKPSLSAPRLKKLRGLKVRVTGWLYYEPDAGSDDPRGTRWELHPVTEATAVK